jgi:hypothetical protein
MHIAGFVCTCRTQSRQECIPTDPHRQHASTEHHHPLRLKLNMKGSFTLAGLFALLTLARAQNETLFSDGVIELNKHDTDPWVPITVGLAAERATSKDSVFQRFSSILGKASRAGLPRDIPGQRFSLALPIDPSSKRISLPADLSAVSSPLDSAPTSSLLRRLYKRGPARSHRRKPQRQRKPQRHGKERKARKHRKSRQHRKTKSRTTAGEWTEVFAKASKLAVKETMTSTITWCKLASWSLAHPPN